VGRKKIIAAICIGLCLLTTALTFGTFTGCESKPKDTAFFLNLQDSVDYVGIATCKECHADHYHTFIETGMGSSFGEANDTKTSAEWDHVNPVYDAKKDMYYLPFQKNGKYYIREYRLKNGDTLHRRTEQITHIVGSGHHTNSHFWQDGEYWYQAPLTFYTQSGKWDLPPGYETTNTGFSRKIDIECMSCHNGMPAVEEGSINKFTRMPAGIDCERCHGPGELHVAEKRKGNIVDVNKVADRTIVNPSRLPWKLQVDICQRCHLQGNNVLKPGKKFTDFRPGMHLDSVFEIYMPMHEKGKAFYMAGHAERLQMSRCFQSSNKTNGKLSLTCITCHNPHVSVRKTNTELFNTACNNCHGKGGNAAKLLCNAPAAELQKKNNNCVGCHMPKSGTADIPHVTVHDHYIRKPGKNEQATDIGKPVGLYAVNQPTPKPEMQLQAYLTWFEKFDANPVYLKNAGMLIDKGSSEQEIHYHYAHGQWNKITALADKINTSGISAWTAYRLGKAFDKSLKTENAVTWYRLAVEKMPLQADFAAELGNALIRTKKYSEAIDVLSAKISQQSKHELTLLNLGVAEWLSGNSGKALVHLKKTVSLYPDNENARLYLAEIYLKLGDTDQARKQLTEALRIQPANTEAKEMLRRL
jgi:cytochrome c-type biogenesis protein CcmH/NrfG